MKLELHRPDAVCLSLDTLSWSTEHLEQSHQEFHAFTWVQLLELPSPFSFDEALLLCQHSDEQWLAWIPDYGEIVLHTSQFCQIRSELLARQADA
ncbi:hypothetical protein I8752_24345 [Nostocaceae cyanobacterium CENA369]|uniref:Uncharacterized protein n=1 Tax=Dendronalium phyllosphericum CENA369 TaxID=1725256 RepID=A0A8J7LK59_9NOST|nr:hypothetical protein [Dendronalium phyllosphericum]MBH8576069.1 hypothetical protein [Dendronalium phyllosphericum CENA369]